MIALNRVTTLAARSSIHHDRTAVVITFTRPARRGSATAAGESPTTATVRARHPSRHPTQTPFSPARLSLTAHHQGHTPEPSGRGWATDHGDKAAYGPSRVRPGEAFGPASHAVPPLSSRWWAPHGGVAIAVLRPHADAGHRTSVSLLIAHLFREGQVAHMEGEVHAGTPNAISGLTALRETDAK